jgi:uncharacterized protein (TIGR03000 family)
MLGLAGALVLFCPGAVIAGPGGGGHGGGGHGGGGHGGGGHSSGGHGGGGSYHGGGGSYHGGYANSNYHNHNHNNSSVFIGVGLGFYPGFYGVYGPSYYSYDDVPSYRTTNVIYTNGSNGSTAPEAPSAPAPDRAYMTIQLPVDKAEVWIEGARAVQEKATQEYVSPPLEEGRKYYYDVRARWTDAKGKTVEAKRSFPIYPGKPVLIDFTEPPAPPSEK